MKLDNKVVVVTGAGSGMGRELVLGLLARGAIVAAVDRKSETLGETATLAGSNARLSQHVLDIADRAGVEALPEAVIAHHGAVDAVINNAGIIQKFVRVQDLSYDDIERVMQVDFYGTVYMVKAFLPHLLERPEAYIANVSSMGAFLPVPGQAIYGAAKAATKLMTEALYAELLETNVGVSVVMPGAVATNIAENSDVHVEAGSESNYKATAADEAAKTILDGIEKDELHILVGSDARLMNLASRVAPKGAIRLIQRKMKDLLDAGGQ
jgi:NAD(P)-dependent dehydrogenase (short-subunit alcohol dehydrogenase family)